MYYRVYCSISNRIILKITRKRLEDANREAYNEGIITQTIASYLPLSLPIDKEAMREMAEELYQSRKRKRLGEDWMELGQCLICRGIELVLKASDLKDEKNLKTNIGDDINDETKKT